MAIPDIDAGIERFTSFDGTMIATASWGDPSAPAVILSNGICCSDTYWTFLQPALVEAGYRVIFFDYRGHKRSGRPGNPNEVTLPSHARDLWAAADHWKVDKAVLVGHSMGVQTCFEAYRQHPDRVEGLVALAGPFEYPLDNVYMTPIAAVLLAGFELTWRHSPSIVRAFWSATGLDTRVMTSGSHLVGAVSRQAPDELVDEYFKNMSELDPLLVINFFQAMQMHSARDVLSTCDVPVLQIAGARDVLTPLPLQREMASLLRDVRFETYSKGSHTLPIDEPERVNTRILAFLQELADKRGAALPAQRVEVKPAAKPAAKRASAPAAKRASAKSAAAKAKPAPLRSAG